MSGRFMTRVWTAAAAVCVAGTAAIAVDSRDNAALRYWRAWSLITEADDQRLGETAWGYEADFETTVELVQFIEEKQPVIELLREAAAMPACDFGIDYEKGPHTLMTHLRPVRTSVHLLTLDARLHANTGDVDTAVADLEAAFRMERHIADGSMIIGSLVSLATFEATNRVVGHLLEQNALDGEAKRALDAVLATYDQHDPFGIKAGVEMERVAMVEWFGKFVVAKDGPGRKELIEMTDEVLGELNPQERQMVEMFRGVEDLQAELDKFDLYYKHVLAIWEDEDAGEKLRTIAEHAAKGDYGFFAGLLAPALGKVHENWERSIRVFAEARERLAA